MTYPSSARIFARRKRTTTRRPSRATKSFTCERAALWRRHALSTRNEFFPISAGSSIGAEPFAERPEIRRKLRVLRLLGQFHGLSISNELALERSRLRRS